MTTREIMKHQAKLNAQRRAETENRIRHVLLTDPELPDWVIAARISGNGMPTSGQAVKKLRAEVSGV